jgi:uncharacterized protein (TIGR02246 family)
MKNVFVLIGIFFSCTCLAQNKDVEALKKLNADWIGAYVTRDTATMSRIFADDLVLTNPSGKAMGKKVILNNLVSPGTEYLATKVDTVSVRLFGNIGIINAKVTATVKSNDKTITATTCYMDVYEKRKGRWYAVAAHVTLLDN